MFAIYFQVKSCQNLFIWILWIGKADIFKFDLPSENLGSYSHLQRSHKRYPINNGEDSICCCFTFGYLLKAGAQLIETNRWHQQGVQNDYNASCSIRIVRDRRGA
jgi:hypothetical protein